MNMSQLFVLYTPFVRIPRDIPNRLHITLSDVYVEKDRDATIYHLHLVIG